MIELLFLHTALLIIVLCQCLKFAERPSCTVLVMRPTVFEKIQQRKKKSKTKQGSVIELKHFTFFLCTMSVYESYKNIFFCSCATNQILQVNLVTGNNS
jgi:hypothetical protein